MTQFKTDFSEYAVDSKPSDWTNQWNSSGEQFHIVTEISQTVGDKILKIDEASSARRGLSWNDVGTPHDVEIFARIRNENAYYSNAYLVARGFGEVGNESAYRFLIFNDVFSIGKYVDGSSINITTFGTPLDNIWYNVRFRVSGEDIKAKAWGDDEDEPDSWNIEETDSSLSGEGWVGVLGFNANYHSSTDFFTVGTGGDSAPDPDYDPREIRVTQLPLEILKGGTPETRLTQLPLEVLSGIPTNRVYQDLVETLSEASGERITKVYQDSFEVLSLSSPISGSKTVVMVIT
jgi:hypothetical protein